MIGIRSGRGKAQIAIRTLVDDRKFLITWFIIISIVKIDCVIIEIFWLLTFFFGFNGFLEHFLIIGFDTFLHYALILLT
jgi:hypothetical protein